MYELKPEFEEECSPFFYHYTKPDHSKVCIQYSFDTES